MSIAGKDNQQEIIIGAGMPRAGSSWLYRNLSLHPHANVSKLKEINYFSINHDRGVDWFDSLYRDNVDHFPRFDISPFYFLDPDFTKNVMKSNYNAKVIVILREPNLWVRSLYYQIKSFTLNMPPFNEFIEEHSIDFDSRSKTIKLKQFDFLNRVQELSVEFKGRLLLVNFEVISHNPLKLLKEIEKFSNLPAYFNEKNIIDSQINASHDEFKWLLYLSTNRYIRSFFNKLPFPTLIKYIQKKLYKENKSNFKGISGSKHISDKDKYEILTNEHDIENQFPPVFKNTFFKENDLLYL